MYRPPSTSSGPVLVLLDTDKQDLECLLDFMYRGEALVSQERLQSFLNLAEKLQVAGLTQEKNESKTPSSKLTQQQTQSSIPKTKLPHTSKPLKVWTATEKCSKEVNDNVGDSSQPVGDDGIIVEDEAMVDNLKKEAEETEDSSINYYSEYWTDSGTQEYYGKPR